ncbi:hypothetical protein NQ317_007572 [Molorchus minor]|uniref:Uncharacterized protein n=1 Tax=Molorchus minor TaxID=1323400 RepID=A0ABQ9ISY4_9CUCU|nr:hypothetical protein NQ317_007572 [Molorchus minor]
MDLQKPFMNSTPPWLSILKEAVSQTLKIISEINEGEVLVTKSNDKLEITIKSYILGFDDTKFKFSEYITAPMIHTIKYLEKQQKMLCDLLLNKDRELEEYKMEKGNISRADLTTERFDPKVVENTSDKLFLNVYNANNIFWDSFVTRYGNIEDKVVDVAVEPWNHIKKKRKNLNFIKLI